MDDAKYDPIENFRRDPQYVKVKPPYPYVGGKSKMLEFVLANVPTVFGDYFEPFLGGGAVAIEMMKQHPTKAFHLSDFNEEVVITWQQIKADANLLNDALAEHQAYHSEPYFKSIRDWDKNGLLSIKPDFERAARFLYMCKASFGGGYRVDDAGECNNQFTQRFSHSPENQIQLGKLLQNRDVFIRHQSYEEIANHLRATDFIYLDPPYATDVEEEGYSPSDDYVNDDTMSIQELVARFMRTATLTGTYALVSNVSTPTTNALWGRLDSTYNNVVFTGGAGRRVSEDRLWANHPLVRALAQERKYDPDRRSTAVPPHIAQSSF